LRLKLPLVDRYLLWEFLKPFLFSTILSLTQLVKNNEFTAMRIGGIGLHRIMVPFLILAIFISGLTYFINERVVPWTNHRSENIVRRIILQDGIPTLQSGVFFKGVEYRYLYINQMKRDDGILKDIEDLKDYKKAGNRFVIVFSNYDFLYNYTKIEKVKQNDDSTENREKNEKK